MANMCVFISLFIIWRFTAIQAEECIICKSDGVVAECNNHEDSVKCFKITNSDVVLIKVQGGCYCVIFYQLGVKVASSDVKSVDDPSCSWKFSNGSCVPLVSTTTSPRTTTPPRTTTSSRTTTQPRTTTPSRSTTPRRTTMTSRTTTLPRTTMTSRTTIPPSTTIPLRTTTPSRTTTHTSVTGFLVWALVATVILFSGVSIYVCKRRYRKCRDYSEIQGGDRPGRIEMSGIDLYTITPSPPQPGTLTPESLQESPATTVMTDTTSQIASENLPIATRTRAKKDWISKKFKRLLI